MWLKVCGVCRSCLRICAHSPSRVIVTLGEEASCVIAIQVCYKGVQWG